MAFVQETTLQDHNMKLKCNRIQNFQKQFEIFDLKVFSSKYIQIPIFLTPCSLLNSNKF